MVVSNAWLPQTYGMAKMGMCTFLLGKVELSKRCAGAFSELKPRGVATALRALIAEVRGKKQRHDVDWESNCASALPH